MTETVLPDAETAEAAKTEPTKPEFVPNEMAEFALKDLAGFYQTINSQAAVLKAASGDKYAIRADLRETSTDPEIVKMREAIETLIAKMDKRLEDANLIPAEITAEDAATARKLYDEAVDAANGLHKLANGWMKGFTDWASVKGYPPVGKAKSPAKSGSEVGAPRPRTYVDVDGKRYDTMSLASNFLQVEVGQLHEAYAAAAGVPVAEIAKVTQVITFDYEVEAKGDRKAATYKVTVTPKKV